MSNDPKRQAEIDHLKRKLYFARQEFQQRERAMMEAEQEVYNMRDQLQALGVDVDTDEEDED